MSFMRSIVFAQRSTKVFEREKWTDWSVRQWKCILLISKMSLCCGLTKVFVFLYLELCVNMVNERIRQFTADVLFQQEQQECLQEGVAMETLRSLGNQTAVLDYFFQVRSRSGFPRAVAGGRGKKLERFFSHPEAVDPVQELLCCLFNCRLFIYWLNNGCPHWLFYKG